MPDHMDDLLHAEAERFAGTLRPRPVHEIRARGDRRRHRAAAVTAALTLTVLAGSGAVAYALAGAPGHGPAPVGPVSPSPSVTPSRPSPTITYTEGTSTKIPASQLDAVPHIVAVSPAGALQVVDAARGLTLRTLVPRGVFLDEISVSPDGRTAYYAAKRGCGAEIYSVPVAGGPSTAIAAGVQPAISPDGTRLAFAREPASGGGPVYQSCGPRSPVSLVIRNLATGAETSYPGPPGAAGPLVFPISHLSWSPDGSRLAVSLGEVQDNNGWGLVVLDPASARYYMPSIRPGQGQVPVQGGGGGYYREGVFLPSGQLLVDRVCCAGVPVRTTSMRIEEVTTSGVVTRVLGPAFEHDQGSFDASGKWVLYTAGGFLYTWQSGPGPEPMIMDVNAAAWIPRNRG